MLIDSHCHLDNKKFARDLDRVLERAHDAGIDRLVTLGDDLFSSRRALKIAGSHPEIRAAVGIHPGSARTWTPGALEEVRKLAEDPNVCAIGEIGLDFHYPGYSADLQLLMLSRQAAIATERGLPMALHCRDAYPELIRFFEGAGNVTSRGVVHCFSGTAAEARRLLDMGFYLGIGGAITYPGGGALRETIQATGLDRIVIETDAPYLAPQKKRGRRNEPSYLKFTVKALADLTGFTYQDVARITSANAARLYALPEDREARIAYRLRDRIYLNLTNRCTNDCCFCERGDDFRLFGHYLKLEDEPSVEAIIGAIEEPDRYEEFVICGLGEPTLRLDAVLELARRLKAEGRRVRLNTNGHGNLIHGRDITGDFAGLLDSVSITMNAHNQAVYNRISCPANQTKSFKAMLEFAKKIKKSVPDVRMKVVALPEVDVEACRAIAEDKIKVRFQVRAPRPDGYPLTNGAK